MRTDAIDEFLDRDRSLFVAGRVDELEHVSTDDLGGADSKHLGHCWVHERCLSLGINDPNALGCAFDDAFVQL